MTNQLFQPIVIPTVQNIQDPVTVSYGNNPMFNFSTGEFYQNSDGSFVLRDNKEGLVNLIRKALATERYVYSIYTGQYGCQINDIIGKNLSSAELRLEVERVIREALIYDPRILTITNFSFTQNNDYLEVNFTYTDIWGNSQVIEVIL